VFFFFTEIKLVYIGASVDIDNSTCQYVTDKPRYKHEIYRLGTNYKYFSL